MDFLDSELIILEVEKYPYLYDTRHQDYKNRDMKRDAWLAVSMNVVGGKWDEMDDKTKSNVGKEVQRRWKSMKDSFTKSVKHDAGKSGDARKPRKPYVYHKQLTFLHAVCEQRETLGNMNTSNETQNNEANESAELLEEVAPVIEPRSRMPRKRKSDTFEKEIINVLKANLNEQAPRIIQDPDEMFLLSQLPLIKKLTPSDKFNFQIKFMQLLGSYNILDTHETLTISTPSASTAGSSRPPSRPTSVLDRVLLDGDYDEDSQYTLFSL